MLRWLDDTKLKILEILDRPMTTTDLAKALGLSKSTISHHLRILLEMKLVRVEKTEIEKNFIKKYYISTLNVPTFSDVFKDFKLSNRELLRTLLRSLALLNLENYIFLRKIGLDIGYFLLADRIEDENVHEGIANLWERLKLGKVVEVAKTKFVVEDCYMCKGLPSIGGTYCKIDEGLIKGILLKKTGKSHNVKEIRCWGTGDEECEFKIE